MQSDLILCLASQEKIDIDVSLELKDIAVSLALDDMQQQQREKESNVTNKKNDGSNEAIEDDEDEEDDGEPEW